MASHKGQVRKRCDRCGWAGWVNRDSTTCWERRFGPSSQYCGGSLLPTAKPKAPKQRASVRPQDVAAKRQAYADRKIDEWIDRVAEAAKGLRRWQATSRKFARLAAMSDAEVLDRAAKARQALANRKTRRRGIRLEGEL